MFADIPLFAGLDQTARAAIEAGALVKNYPKGAVIITQDDDSGAMYLVLEGRLRVYRTNEDGKEIVLGALAGGDYFGELAVLDPGPRSASVMALQPSRLAMLSREHVIRCIEQQPKIALNLLASLAARFRALVIATGDLALLDVYGRVARLLLERSQERDGERLTEPMTQQEIADQIGASREMVSRILKELRAGGYVTLRGRQIVLHRNLPARW